MRRVKSLNGIKLGDYSFITRSALWPNYWVRLGERVVSRHAPRYVRRESGNKT